MWSHICFLVLAFFSHKSLSLCMLYLFVILSSFFHEYENFGRYALLLSNWFFSFFFYLLQSLLIFIHTVLVSLAGCSFCVISFIFCLIGPPYLFYFLLLFILKFWYFLWTFFSATLKSVTSGLWSDSTFAQWFAFTSLSISFAHKNIISLISYYAVFSMDWWSPCIKPSLLQIEPCMYLKSLALKLNKSY